MKLIVYRVEVIVYRVKRCHGLLQGQQRSFTRACALLGVVTRLYAMYSATLATQATVRCLPCESHCLPCEPCTVRCLPCESRCLPCETHCLPNETYCLPSETVSRAVTRPAEVVYTCLRGSRRSYVCLRHVQRYRVRYCTGRG